MKVLAKYSLTLVLFLMTSALVSCGRIEHETSDAKYLDVDRARKSPNLKVIDIPTGTKTEVCIIPSAYPGLGGTMQKTVFGSAKLDELCKLRFAGSDTNYAICPKDNSTNPAIEIFDISKLGVTRQVYENATSSTGCNKSREGKKLAKFKGTVTCSSTAAILTAYYLSRFLDVGNVPASVLRTIDVTTMRNVTRKGLQSPLSGSWAQWDKVLNGSASPEIKDLTFTSDRQFIYGALSDNPRGEHKYPGHNVSTYGSFLATAMMRKATSQGAAELIFENKKGIAAYALTQEIKGFSDLVIFDTLLSQQDRLGNIASRTKYFGFDIDAQKYDSEKTEDEANLRFGRNQYVAAEEILLKDNDCGIRGSQTVFLANKTSSKLTHVSPETYVRLRWLAEESKSGRLAEFLIKSASRHDMKTAQNRWGNTVIASIDDGLKRMDSDFYSRCINGSLKLDLDPRDIAKNGYPKAEELKRRCSLVWNPTVTSSAGTQWQPSKGGTKVIAGPIFGPSSSPERSQPNVCTSTTRIAGQCITVSQCNDKGPSFTAQPGRCLRDPVGVQCCFKN
jgi:hypothetical protein